MAPSFFTEPEKNDCGNHGGSERPRDDSLGHGKVVVQRAERPGSAAERDEPGKHPQDAPQRATNHFRSPRAKIVMEEFRRIKSIAAANMPGYWVA
jgi:hypothetical protein